MQTDQQSPNFIYTHQTTSVLCTLTLFRYKHNRKKIYQGCQTTVFLKPEQLYCARYEHMQMVPCKERK